MSSAKDEVLNRKKKRKFSALIPPCRIKRVLQVDDEIGRMTAAVPVVLGRAMEHFAAELLLESEKVATGSEAKTLTIRHMKEAIARNPAKFSLLEPLVSGIIDDGRKVSTSKSAGDAGGVERKRPRVARNDEERGGKAKRGKEESEDEEEEERSEEEEEFEETAGGSSLEKIDEVVSKVGE